MCLLRAAANFSVERLCFRRVTLIRIFGNDDVELSQHDVLSKNHKHFDWIIRVPVRHADICIFTENR